MKKALLFFPLLLLSACSNEKTYIVGEDAFCKGVANTDIEDVFCVDSKDAPVNGLVIEYYENGKVLREMHIKDGRENGTEKEYYENGNLRVVAEVKDGKADGPSKLYNENGKLYMEIDWVNGTATKIQIFDDAGNIISVAENI